MPLISRGRVRAPAALPVDDIGADCRRSTRAHPSRLEDLEAGGRRATPWQDTPSEPRRPEQRGARQGACRRRDGREQGGSKEWAARAVPGAADYVPVLEPTSWPCVAVISTARPLRDCQGRHGNDDYIFQYVGQVIQTSCRRHHARNIVQPGVEALLVSVGRGLYTRTRLVEVASAKDLSTFLCCSPNSEHDGRDQEAHAARSSS